MTCVFTSYIICSTGQLLLDEVRKPWIDLYKFTTFLNTTEETKSEQRSVSSVRYYLWDMASILFMFGILYNFSEFMDTASVHNSRKHKTKMVVFIKIRICKRIKLSYNRARMN